MVSNTDPRTGETLVTVSGIVRDANTGDTLPGAHVYYLDADGMAHGEATSAAGAFGLVVPVGSTRLGHLRCPVIEKQKLNSVSFAGVA